MVLSPVKQEFRWRMRKSGKRIVNICTVFSFYSALTLGVLTAPAMANPQGGAVVDGSASIATVGSELQIHQSSDKAIIEWSSFDIDAGETTRFYQPSSSALALNRVVNSNQVSQINGNLIANGRVILVNPNGVLIGATGNIDANSFIATTADIDNADFMSMDVLNFNRPGNIDGIIQNEGQITIADEGLGALVAPVVRNDGIIQGNMVKVQLAAADTFAVDFFGDGLLSFAVQPSAEARELLAENSGSIITDGGAVLMTAADASDVVSSVINMDGVIQAQSLSVQNGEIILSANGADVNVSGTLDVSGAEATADGGTIKIGGDYKGTGSLATSDTVTIDPAAVIFADGGDTANGGEIIVWSDVSTELHGSLSARGGDTSGDGGTIETSSAGTLGSTGTFVDTSAPNGAMGSWIIDPPNITVYETGSPGINGTSGIDVADINNSLTNYSLIATNSINFQANINIEFEGAGLIAVAGDQAGSDMVDPIYGTSVAAGIGSISVANNFIRTNGGEVNFLTGGAISVNNMTFFLRGGDLVMTAGSISINNNAAISTAGGDVLFTAIAAGTGSNKTSGNISTNSVYIETTDQMGMVIGGISVTDKDGIQDYENDYGNNQNEFYDDSPGGAIVIDADGTAKGNSVCFAAGSAGNCVVLDPLPPIMITITADDLMKVYGDADPLLTYSFTGDLAMGDSFDGLLVRDSGEDVGDYTILQGTLTIVGGNATYDITYVPGTFTITPAELTITADHQTKVYGDADPMLTYMASGFKFMDDESILTGALDRDAGENVGFYDINQNTLDAGSNYFITYIGHDLDITPATLTITADHKIKEYGDADPMLTYMASGFKFMDDESLITGELDRDPGENVGFYDINQNTLAAGSNYVISYTGHDLEITPATLTITADHKVKEYGDADPMLTFMASGFKFMDDETILTGALDRVAGENVGFYDINQNTLAAGSNYVIDYTGHDLEITPATLTITADHKVKEYGDADPTLTYMASGFKFMDDESLITGELNRDPGEDVGFYDINKNTLDAGLNYTISYTGHDLEITPAPLTITANDDSKVYDAVPYSGGNGVTYDGFKFMDDEGDLGGMLVFGGTSQGATNVGSYVIEPSGLTSGNYDISYVDGELTITAAELLLITADDQMKIYGDTFLFNGTEFMTSGLLGMDSVDSATLTSTGAVNTANVGDYDIIISDPVGSGLGNYDITLVNGTLTVNPAELTITADHQVKEYGDADPALTFMASGFKNMDDESILTGVLDRDAGEDVGFYDINQNTLDAGANYFITYNGHDLEITPATLTITADPKSKLFGDIDPELTYTASGFKFDDNESLLFGALERDPGEDVGAYEINQGTVDIESQNYMISYVSDFLTIFAPEAEPVIVEPLLELDPLNRPIISVANQSLVFDQSFEPVEVLEVNTDVSIAYSEPAATGVLAGLEPAGGEGVPTDVTAVEPAAGGDEAAPRDETNEILCANAYLDNDPCEADIAP